MLLLCCYCYCCHYCILVFVILVVLRILPSGKTQRYSFYVYIKCHLYYLLYFDLRRCYLDVTIDLMLVISLFMFLFSDSDVIRKGNACSKVFRWLVFLRARIL